MDQYPCKLHNLSQSDRNNQQHKDNLEMEYDYECHEKKKKKKNRRILVVMVMATGLYV